jgi:hypothetical protein
LHVIQIVRAFKVGEVDEILTDGKVDKISMLRFDDFDERFVADFRKDRQGDDAQYFDQTCVDQFFSWSTII